MGLAGRKIKQRIDADPRNLTWADDASKFGSAYLAKFGWESSKGLGISGDGRTTHVKVQQKLDMLGVGAAHMRDPNGIAWKQNKDFENMLKRLNEQIDEEGGNNEEKIQGTKVEGFVSGVKGGDGATEVTSDEEHEAQKAKKKKKKKDRESKKTKKEKDGEQEEGKKRKRKDEKDKEYKTKKRKTNDIGESPEDSSEKRESKKSTPRASETPAPTIIQPIIPRLRAHRARAIAAKKMLSSSATAISEILGIAPTPPSSIAPSGSATSLDNDTVSERITTSAMSVADYFKEKLSSMPAGRSSGSRTPSSASGKNADADIHDAPRGGLGLSRCRMDSGGMASHGADDANGMNKSPSLMVVSKFLAATSTAIIIPSAPEGAPDHSGGAAEGRGESVEDADIRRRRKKDKKQKKDRNQIAIDQEPEGHDCPRKKSKKEKNRRKDKDECSVAAV